jgi:5-methylcytosine-specific restriction protein B
VVVFVIGGKNFDISRQDVEKALKSLQPEPLKGRAKYYIEYNGRRYPIKQVLAVVTGLPRVGFTAADAYRVLTKLGFRVETC